MQYDGIILSGFPVSGKSTLAKRLSGIYQWPVYSVSKAFRDAWQQKYPDGKVTFEEYWRNEITFEQNMDVNVIAHGVFEKGKVIGETRYTYAFRDLPLLFVFLAADLDVRAERGSKERYKGNTPEEVKRILLQRESDELVTGFKLFGDDYDWRKPQHYHLTLNSGMLTMEQEIEIVRSAMNI
ncbi:MAG: cytidylate kinase family protein [Candidatus Aenigmatarchaeota archaeon]